MVCSRESSTASLIDTVLGRSKYQTAEEVLFKCGIKRPFLSNEATRHGQKYEDEAIAHYCQRYNKNLSFDYCLILQYHS